MMQVVPDTLRGSFLSHNVSSSTGEFAILTLLCTLHIQLAPVSHRTNKIHFGSFFFILTQKLPNFQSEQCLLVKLKPAVGLEIVAGVQSPNIRPKR